VSVGAPRCHGLQTLPVVQPWERTLWQADIESVGIALKAGWIDADQAVEALADCDCLQLIHPREPMATKKRRNNRLPPFVPVTRAMLDLPAWKACSPGARLLYIALKRFLNEDIGNNGQLYLSYRDACDVVGTRSFQSIARWFAELEFYGFIVKTAEGCLGVHGMGISPHYRLTERPYKGDPATRDHERWDGVLFVDPQTEKRRLKKQNPVPVAGTLRSRDGNTSCPPGRKKRPDRSRDGYIEPPMDRSRDGYITS